jgi:hypothetical protein
LGAFEFILDIFEFIRTRHYAAWARLSASAATRHYGRGPPVSPFPLPYSPDCAAWPRPPVSGCYRSGAVRRLAGNPLPPPSLSLSLSRSSPVAWCHPVGRPPPLRTGLKWLPPPPHTPPFPPFSLIFPGRTSSPNTPPHLLLTADDWRTPACTAFRSNRAAIHHSSVNASPSHWSPQSTAPPHHVVPLELQDLTALVSDHRKSARRRLRRLVIDPPFWCALAPSSLSGVLPVVPVNSLATPCRPRRAAGKRATVLPRARTARGAHAMSAPRADFPAGPGRQAEAHAAVRPLCVTGRRALWTVAVGRI